MQKEEVMNKKEIDPETLINARIGYQGAISAWINENRQNWDKTRILLLFNSLLLAGVLQLLLKEDKYPYLSLILCIFGLIICALWTHILYRGLKYNDYWINSAREIEEYYLKDAVKTFSHGALFSNGKLVSFSHGKDLKISILPKITVKKSIYILIIMIALLYFIGVVYSVSKQYEAPKQKQLRSPEEIVQINSFQNMIK
jgi:hypothetical protein